MIASNYNVATIDVSSGKTHAKQSVDAKNELQRLARRGIITVDREVHRIVVLHRDGLVEDD